MELNSGIDTLKGIGPKKKMAFEKRGISTIQDLILFFPRAYENRAEIKDIAALKSGDAALISGVIRSAGGNGKGYRRNTVFTVKVQDNTGTIDAIFFNSFYKSSDFKRDVEYVFYGKISETSTGRKQMVHPDFAIKGSEKDIRGIVPVYPLIDGLSQNDIRKCQRLAMEAYDDIEEWLPEKVAKEYKLASLGFTVKNIHFPQDKTRYSMARYRMVFEEFFALETGLLFMKKGEKTRSHGPVINTDSAKTFIDDLPFQLTEGQVSAWNDIEKDLSNSKPMNRLIQGDVGSGKTVIAEIAMFTAFSSGFQSVMMAPTEILAKQHFQSITEDFKKYGIRTGLLCSSLKASEKKETLDKLYKGEIDVIIGTHALIEPSVQFKKLGLVITDEQHRFGVNQRRFLTEKGENPNVMVMTATPIPRTLAVVLYGDFDISQIRTMPHGRKPIITQAVKGKGRKKVYDFVESELLKKHQAYVVAPLIDESDKINAISEKELYEELKKRFKNFNTGFINGAMPQDEKDQVMGDFADGKIDLLVSTVVIEVGINVRNATVIVIENSERFGLAQMHQLRGRVGRGDDQSYCFLICDSQNETSIERAKILTKSSDGFEIAEEDLKLRGPGEIFGTKQHGLPELYYGDLIRHADVLETAKNAAIKVLNQDPTLAEKENQGLKNRIQKIFGENISLNL